MQTIFRGKASRCFVLLAALLLALASGGLRAQATYVFSQPELEQMLAPVALYPDPLLSQVLLAAGYPADVVEAARWSREHADLAGEAAVSAAENESWDASVKSLLAFPQLLEYLRDNLQWTQALGDAFLDQQDQVMDAVQALRRRAQTAGSLRSDDHLSVVDSGSNLLLQPTDAQVVYVPYYDPLVVYGSWTWTAYPPVLLRPWRGYRAPAAAARPFHWGPPVAISAGFFRRAIDRVRVPPVRNSYTPATVAQPGAKPRPRASPSTPWRPGANRDRVPAYASAGTPQQFGAPSPATQGYAGAQTQGGRGTQTEQRHESAPRFDDAGATRTRPQPPAFTPVPQFDAGARAEVARPPVPHMAPHVALGAPPQRPAGIAAVAPAPATRNQVPAASAPRAAMPSAPAAAHPEPAARSGARFGMRQ